jgi:hypothetical protein
MATTPEGRVKKRIKAILDKYRARIYVRMHVPSGYGKQTLDYEGAVFGRAFSIEAKQPLGVLTERQLGTIEDMEAGGVMVFVIEDERGCDVLDGWLNIMCRKGVRT